LYKVVINNTSGEEVILDSLDPKEKFLIDPKVAIGVSCEIPTFEFSIYPINPGYSTLTAVTTYIIVYDLLDGRMIFKGRTASVDEVMNDDGTTEKTVTCEGDIAILCDTSIYNYRVVQGSRSDYVLDQLITNHNKYVDDDRKFEVGTCEMAGCPETVDIFDGATTYDAIKTIFEDTYGGEIRIRYDNGTRYIDYTTGEYGEKVNAGLQTRVNIKSMSKKEEINELFTCLIPLGGALPSSNSRLTMLPYTNTLPSDTYPESGKDYFESETLVAKYGRIYKVETFDVEVDENDPDENHVGAAATLYTTAKEWFEDYEYETESFEISALDLSFINDTFDRYEVCNTYTVVNPFLSIETDVRLIKLEINLSTPYAPTLTFGSKTIKLTDMVANSK
jgi:hypothetical protein